MEYQRDVRHVKGAVMRGDATPFVDEENVTSSRAVALAGRGSSSSSNNNNSTNGIYGADLLLPFTRRAASSESRRESKGMRILTSRHHDQPGGTMIR
jgi:hypothetical protein